MPGAAGTIRARAAAAANGNAATAPQWPVRTKVGKVHVRSKRSARFGWWWSRHHASAGNKMQPGARPPARPRGEPSERHRANRSAVATGLVTEGLENACDVLS